MINRLTQSNHWKNDKNLNTIESYWTSPPATKRSKWFVEQLKKYDFNSIFEVGFFAGRNVKYIKEAFPEVHVSGLEINPKAVRFAREKLNMNEDLMCMDLHTMSSLNKTYDVVFSSGVLIHIVPEDIKDVVEKMIKMSNKYVMHIEHLGNNELAAGPKHLKPKYKESSQCQWNPNLVGVYKNLGFEPEIIPLPDDCKTNGARELIVVKI